MDVLDDLIGVSPAIESLRGAIRQITRASGNARRLPPVLLTGETGTGKGLIARLMHRAGPRAAGPFVDVNCAALPETLIEAEFFGYERGAFTGARHAKPGFFQSAQGGTIFLDEVGLLGVAVQAKLLKALENGCVRRLGAVRDEPVDVWIVSATNADLAGEIAARRFREDLYHRLAVVTLSLPPLREREDDALILAEHFLARACREYGTPACALTSEARRQILAHDWPGNVRELANVMERVALLVESPSVTAAMLALPAPAVAAPAVPAGGGALDEVLKHHVGTVLAQLDGNISRASATLGITRNTLRSYIRKFGLAGGPSRGRLRPPAAAPAPAAIVEAAPAPAVPVSWSALRWSPRLVTLLAVSLRAPADVPGPGSLPIIQELFETVSAFGGRLEDVRPHAMVVAFGLDAAEDAPRRAAAAALASRAALARRAPGAAPPLTGRWALHVARCVIASGADVARIDADDKRAALAVLDSLVDAAEEASILVSPGALPHLERRFELDATTHALSEAGPVSRLVGRARTGFEVGGQVLSRFVGRDHDLGVLHDRLARAESGHGQVVAIVSDPGVGKSRLVYEFRRRLAPQAVTYLEGHCLSYGTTTPYLPIIDLVRDTFGLTEADDVETVMAAVRAGLEGLGLGGDDRVAHLLHLLGFKAGTERLHGQSPQAVKTGTLHVLRQMAMVGSRQRPIVAVVEDLQWIDSASETALAGLVESLAASRVLLLTTYRPGYRPPWLGRAHAAQLALGPLAPADSRAVLDSVAGPRGLPTDLGARILERAEGVPFFIEELARAVTEAGAGDEGLPDTIEGALMARLDRLAPADRDLLQVAAVVGKDFSPAILAAAAQVPEEEVERVLGRLGAADFVLEQSPGDATERTFTHALTHEAAYRSLLARHRRELHARVADALETLGPHTSERWPEILAHHRTEAGQAREAVEYWLRAAQHALQRSANAEAIAHLRRGLALLETLPGGPERRRQELVLQLTLCTALAAQHGYAAAEVEQALGRVRELTREPDAPPERLVGRFALWRFALSRADFGQAEELATELLASVDGQEDPQVLIPGHIASAVTGFYLGDLRRAERHCARVIALQEPSFGRGQAVLYGQDLGVAAFSFLGWTRALRGQLDQAIEAAEQALTRARQGGHRFSVALALHWYGLVRGERREAAALTMLGEELLALSREQHFEFFVALAVGLLGWARTVDGDAAGGLALLREGAERYARAGQMVGLRLRIEQGQALLAAGADDEAREIADAALAHAEATREEGLLSEVYRVKGEALARQAPADAEALLARALALAEGQGADLLSLRAATSLVRVRGGGVARAALRAVHARFTEGLALPDLVAARALLAP